MYGPDAREQNEADPDPLQWDLSSISNMDFEYLDWDGVERNDSASMNHATAQDRENLAEKTILPSLQNKMNERTRLAPRVLNRVSFCEDGCVPTPRDEVVERVKFYNPPITVPVVHNAPPADLIGPSEFSAIEPHLFDLSLSPILELSPHEENTSILQAQSNSNTNISTEVTSCLETTNEISNRISSNDQKSNHTVQVAVDTGTIKPETLCPHSLQNQQNVFLGEGEIVTHNKETEDTSDLIINFAKDKVTSVPSPSGIVYTDSHRSLTDDRDRLLNTFGENSKFLVENTEIHLRDCYGMNQGIDMLSTATDSIFHLGAADSGQKGKPSTDITCLDPDLSVDPATRENVNKLKATADVILDDKGKSAEIRGPKTNLEAKKALNKAVDIFDNSMGVMLLNKDKECASKDELCTKGKDMGMKFKVWNESVDIFDTSTDVMLLKEAKDCTNKGKLCTRGKDMSLKYKVPQVMNESVDFFNTSCDTTPQPKSRDGRKEEKVCDEMSDILETSHKIATKPQIFRDSEEHARTQERIQTPKKPTFRAPYKAISESPIIGYPLNRRNITSTPKEAQQKKVLRFGSGYSSDSSDTNDGMAHNSYFKGKNLTEKADTRVREPSLALCRNLVKNKHEFKPKFMSGLSSFKFSVDHMKETQKGEQSCLREKNSTKNAKQLSLKPEFDIQKSLDHSASSTAKATAIMNPWNHTKTEDKYENSFTEKTDELENGKSDITQEINTSAVHSKEPANTVDSGGTCYKTVDKHTRKLSEFRLDQDKQVDPVVSEDTSGTKEGCSLHKAWEADKETSEKANIHVTKHTGAAKSLSKRKNENQAHTTAMIKKKMRVTESHIHCQAGYSSKKAKKRKSKSFRKTTSESQPMSKNKDTRKCLVEDFVICRDDNCKNDREKNRSVQEHAVATECSESTVNLSQVG